MTLEKWLKVQVEAARESAARKNSEDPRLSDQLRAYNQGLWHGFMRVLDNLKGDLPIIDKIRE